MREPATGPLTTQDYEASVKTITFYAYKGGTGRSLVVANAAKYLAGFGQHVFALDFDLEAPELHYKFSDPQRPLPVTQGVVDFFARYKQTRALPDSLDSFQVPVPLPAATTGSIRLMPAGTAPSSAYWRTLAGLNWHDFFYRPGAQGLAVFLELKERIRDEFSPDFLLIDARTGITEVGGIATTVLPDIVVCLLVNNRENLEGVRSVLRGIQRCSRPPSLPPIQVVPVLAHVPHREKEVDVIAEEVRDFLNEQAEQLEDTLQIPKLYLLHSDPDLELHERLMMADGGSPAPSYLREDYLRLFRCIVPENIDYYLSTLAQQTAYLTLIGMGRSLQVELPIDEAYVPLRTTMARWRGEDGPDHLRQDAAGLEEDVELSEVFRQAARSGRRGVVLLGEPGSGKTTGARQLAWRLASRHTPPQDLGLPAGVTPVLLRFRNLRPSLLAQPNGLRAFLEAEVGYREGPGGGCEAGPDLWNRRGLLWILDGLDEVVEPGARRTVSRWVQQTLEDRPDDWFLVTCRFQGYYREGVPLGPKFAEFHVRPLDDGQVQRFVRDWFAAAYGKLLGPGPRAATRAQADSDELLESLARPAYQTGHLRELCTNPLLLTILCIVFHEERKLPTGRAELYAHCVRVLLEYWRRDLYRSELGTELQPYDAEAAQAVLARVGWWMHQEQYRTAAPLDELAAEASRGLAEVAASSGLGRDGPAFLERMRDEAGILAMAGEGRCGFLHLSFQEYLAAEHAAREGLARPVATRAPESWWREVALLSLRRSRPFCEVFFRELLQAGIAEQHPDLAQRCLEETLYFTPSPFLEVLQRRRPQETDAARTHDARIAATLRLLRERAEQVPELEDICRRLADSPDQETRGFAREILARLGIAVPVEPAEGGVVVDQRTGISFVAVAAGEFQMGSEKGYDCERPVDRVRITHGFLLGKYPVTNAQYARFLEAAGESVQKPAYWDDRRFNQPEQPVVGVSWEEARAYCEWAGGRLPTEAEWEYACRAGTRTEYCFGDDAKLLEEYAWFYENSGGQTQPVRAKKPNAWGLHDMHGNVWEWCQDSYAGYAASPATDPRGPSSGSYRVYRGGSWGYDASRCRASCRCRRDPGDRIDFRGFRLARAVS